MVLLGIRILLYKLGVTWNYVYSPFIYYILYRYGRMNEAEAISELNSILEQEGLGEVEECGIFVDIWKVNLKEL